MRYFVLINCVFYSALSAADPKQLAGFKAFPEASVAAAGTAQTSGSAAAAVGGLACEAAMKKAMGMQSKCLASFNVAGMACIGEFSNNIRQGAALVGILGTFAKTASPRDVCKKQKDTLGTVMTLVTAYNAACTAAMAICNSSCGGLEASINAAAAACIGDPNCKVQAANGNMTCETAATNAATQAAGWATANKSLLGQCASYKFNLMAAGAGLISIIAEKGKAAGCEKDTQVVCAPGDNSPFCQGINGNTQANIDCSKEENANNTKCICQKAPNTPGCPGAAAGGDNGGSRNANRNSGPSNGAAPGSGKKDNVSFDGFQPTISPTGGSGGGGSSAGGGSGGGGSAGGSVGGGGGSGADNA
ncbi:MAG: hypothetical protein ACK5RO_11590, partial [Pseudobdellovibrionaceae bacterium]